MGAGKWFGRRWWAMLSVAAQDALCATLVEGGSAEWASPAGFLPRGEEGEERRGPPSEE